jgi:LysM repeat protein
VAEEEVKQPAENTEIVSNPIKISFSDTIINYTVLDQETLYSISKRFMVPVEELQKLNGLKNSKIKPGDVLKIPVKKESIQKVEIRPVPQKEIRKTDSTLLYPKKNTYKIAIMLPFNLDKGGQDYFGFLRKVRIESGSICSRHKK